LKVLLLLIVVKTLSRRAVPLMIRLEPRAVEPFHCPSFFSSFLFFFFVC